MTWRRRRALRRALLAVSDSRQMLSAPWVMMDP
jgi:hypothetical protein